MLNLVVMFVATKVVTFDVDGLSGDALIDEVGRQLEEKKTTLTDGCEIDDGCSLDVVIDGKIVGFH